MFQKEIGTETPHFRNWTKQHAHASKIFTFSGLFATRMLCFSLAMDDAVRIHSSMEQGWLLELLHLPRDPSGFGRALVRWEFFVCFWVTTACCWNGKDNDNAQRDFDHFCNYMPYIDHETIQKPVNSDFSIFQPPIWHFHLVTVKVICYMS